jgi:hypothetical protein
MYTASQDLMTSDKWIANDVAENGPRIRWATTTSTFAWRSRCKPRNTSVGIACVRNWELKARSPDYEVVLLSIRLLFSVTHSWRFWYRLISQMSIENSVAIRSGDQATRQACTYLQYFCSKLMNAAKIQSNKIFDKDCMQWVLLYKRNSCKLFVEWLTT